jgi:single-stranded DNA-binding protein
VALGFEKGENLYIEGAIEQREFTPKDGSPRTINEIVVRHCHVIAPSRQTAAAGAKDEAASAADAGPHSNTGATEHDDDWPVR